MVQLDAKGMKKHFGVGVAFNIVTGFVKLLNNGFLLADAAELVEAQGKIKFVVHASAAFTSIIGVSV